MHTVAGQKLHSTDDELYDSGAVKALKKEVRKLREQLKVMTVCPATATTEWPTHQQTPVRRASEDSCCRCAEDGCVATWCRAPEDPQKVVQKFIETQRKGRDSRRGPRGRDAQPCLTVDLK